MIIAEISKIISFYYSLNLIKINNSIKNVIILKFSLRTFNLQRMLSWQFFCDVTSYFRGYHEFLNVHPKFQEPAFFRVLLAIAEVQKY